MNSNGGSGIVHSPDGADDVGEHRLWSRARGGEHLGDDGLDALVGGRPELGSTLRVEDTFVDESPLERLDRITFEPLVELTVQGDTERCRHGSGRRSDTS